MTELQSLLGAAATIIGIVGYIPYFWNIFLGKTKPHAFSWLVWTVLTGIAFAAQLSENAGAGAWVTGATVIACFLIFVLALIKGQKTFPSFNWVSLVVAGISLLLWRLTNDPTLSIIMIAIVDAVGYLPTFRKGYRRPNDETATTFALSSLKFIPALFALETHSIATWFYPASLVLMNGAFVVMLLIRRQQIKNQS